MKKDFAVAMNILWLTWKDCSHPRAGGAEYVNETLAARLAEDGHRVKFIVANFDAGDTKAPEREMRDGFEIIRLGRKFSVYFKARSCYKKNFQGWPDLVIDEANTMPFFASLYVKEKVIMFFHQLCRDIWFYEMEKPWGLLGYLLEPVYLSWISYLPAITVSESTRKDLIRHGFSEQKISLVSEGIDCTPLPEETINRPFEHAKYPHPTLLTFGEIRPMKRTHHAIHAFNMIKSGEIPAPPNFTNFINFENFTHSCKLIIAGSPHGRYGAQVRALADRSPFKSDIEFLGRVDDAKKLELLQKSHLLLATPVKEGWGLTVTEAASQGTPTIGYNVDGLCDAIKHGETGILTELPSPDKLAESALTILGNPGEYARLRQSAWQHARAFTIDRMYREFLAAITEFAQKK